MNTAKEMQVKGRTFSFGELWTGGQGGWPCEVRLPGGKQCGRLSNIIQLSAQETAQLNQALPHTLIDGRAQGSEAASFILQNKLGGVVCDQHVTET